MKNNLTKKVLATSVIMSLIVTSFPTVINNVYAASAGIYINYAGSNVTRVQEGGAFSVDFKYVTNGKISSLMITKDSVSICGFSANIQTKVISKKDTEALVRVYFTNVKNGEGRKTVKITGGTAMDPDGNLSGIARAVDINVDIYKAQAPILTIAGPSPSKIYAGGTVEYKLVYTDDTGIASILTTADSIALCGFTADKEVIKNSDNTVTVILKNVQGSVGGGKTIKVTGGTAMDVDGNLSNIAKSGAFIIEEKTTTPVVPTEPEKPVTPEEPTKPEDSDTPIIVTPDKPADWVENPYTGI